MPRNESGSSSDSDSDWNEELINAVRKKQGKSETISEEDRIKRIQECLNEGADINAVEKHNNTALHLAVKKGYTKIIQFLVERKAKIDVPNRNGQTVLQLAEASGKGDIASALKGLPRYGSQPAPAQQTVTLNQTTSYFDQNPSTSGDKYVPSIGHSSLKDAGASLKRKNSGENDDNLNGKKQRHCTVGVGVAAEEGNDINFEEDTELEDDSFEDEIGNPRSSELDGNSKYAASGLKHTLHGNIYQLRLLMLFLKRGLREGYAFRLATEMDAAEKFDDLVFQYQDKTGNGTVYRFLQAKHKQDETKKIGVRDLLTEKDDEFSLQKYFISYCKIKKHSELSRSAFKDFVLCTNIDFDFEGHFFRDIKTANIHLDKVNEPDDFLDIKSSTKQTARYKFRVDKQSTLREILKRTAEAHALGKVLVELVYGSKSITLGNELFKLYHTALAEKVIDVKNRQFFPNFVADKDLPEREKIFRKIFYAEALKQKKLSELTTPEATVWEEIKKYPLKLSSSFGERFKLSTDPRLTDLKQFSEEFVELIKAADGNNLVEVNRNIYRKNAPEGSNKRILADNIDKLAGHVLIKEDDKLKFRSQFLDDTVKPPGNIGDLRDLLKAQLGSTYNDLDRYQFGIKNFKTCEEEQLYAKTELPKDEVKDEDIDEFFEKLIFAVNQPNEIELGDVITSEIAADSKFNLLDADLVGHTFQKEMLDWFKEKGREKGEEGRFFSAEDGRAFFDSAERKVNTLVSSGLSLSYPEELEEYGVTFEGDNEELREFLTPDDAGLGTRPALNLISVGDSLPTTIRVHRAIRQSGRYEENDSFMFLRLRTLRLPGIRKRVLRAFESPRSHCLLVIDCGSAGKQNFQLLYNRLFETTKRNIGKKLILVTQEKEPSANRGKTRLKNCYETYDDVCFNDLTIESRLKLIGKPVINFQGQRGATSLGRLLGIRGRDELVTEELANFVDAIDRSTLVKLIRGEEIKLGNGLKGLGEIENHYISRTINRQVIIKDDIFKSQSKTDLFAVSGADRRTLVSLMTDGGKVRSFDELTPGEQHLNEFIILDTEREAEQFEELCKNSFVNVHWLKRQWGQLIWEKSRGDITTLVAHRDAGGSRRSYSDYIREKTDPSCLTEDQLVDDDEEREVVIISDSAGMGKTTVFTYLARKMKEKLGLWVIRIDLNDFTGVLCEELKSRSFNDNDIDKAVKFFVEKLTNLETDFEKKILKEMIRNRDGVALLFDGFDEISPEYKNTVIDLLQVFQKIRVSKLFVATRPHMREALEDKLGIFSHTMEPFSEPNQIEFLVRYWKTGLGLNRVEDRIEERLETYAVALTKKMVNSIDDWVKEFAGIPLQTRMMAEIFQDDKGGKVVTGGSEMCEEFLHSENDEPKLPGKMRLVDLYRSFVEQKYYIYRTEKKKDDPTNLGVEEDSEDLHEIFLKRHQKLALLTLFNAQGFLNFLGPPVLPILLDNQEVASVNAYVSKIIEGRERTGIITQVRNGKPQFIHRTFAEYFAAIFIINTLLKQVDHNPKVREFVAKQILLESNYKIIRAFLNDLLLEKSSSADHRYLSNASASESWKSVLNDSHGLFGDSVFHRSASEGNYEILKFLLNRFEKHDETRKYLINSKDAFSETILHVAATQQHWDEMIWLVEKEGADVNCLTKTGETVLHVAASRGNLLVVKWLIKKAGALADALTQDGRTPVYDAVRSGRLDVMEWLVNATGANVNSRNKYGKTVLHFAASIGQLEIVKWLVNVKNADLNAKVNDGKTVLHEAADKGQWEVVKWLIVEKKVDVDSEGNNRGTILQIAASSGDLDIVEWLIEQGADINAKSSHGNTILHTAVSDRRWAVFRWLVENGADVNVKSWVGNTVLHETALHNRWDLAKWLVEERDADVKATGMNNMTLLHEAARKRQWDLVKWLLENKDVDVNGMDHDKGTILCYAASQERWDTVTWLVKEKKADVNIKLFHGKAVLHWAAEKNRWDFVNWLVCDEGADINIRGNDGMTLLHYAASSGKIDLVKSLLEKGTIDVSVKTNNGMTALHCAASSGSIPLVKLIVETGGSDIEARSYKGETALHTAGFEAHWDLVRWLVEEKGANVKAENCDGLTVLHSAARFGQWDQVKLILNSNDVDVNMETRNGDRVLLYAIQSGNFDAIKWLIEKKAVDVDAKFRNGKTILHYAATSGNLQLVEWLVCDKRADFDAVDRTGRTILHEAARAGRYEVLKWLLEKKSAAFKTRDNCGRTLLHEAAIAADLDVIRLLVESCNVDVTAADDDYETALDLYCKNRKLRDEKAILQLLEQGDCNLQSALRNHRRGGRFRPPWRQTGRSSFHGRERRIKSRRTPR